MVSESRWHRYICDQQQKARLNVCETNKKKRLVDNDAGMNSSRSITKTSECEEWISLVKVMSGFLLLLLVMLPISYTE